MDFGAYTTLVMTSQEFASVIPTLHLIMKIELYYLYEYIKREAKRRILLQ